MDPEILKYVYSIRVRKYIATETVDSLPSQIFFRPAYDRLIRGRALNHNKLRLKGGAGFSVILTRLSDCLQWIGNYAGLIIVDRHPGSYARIFHFPGKKFPSPEEAEAFAINFLTEFFSAKKSDQIQH